MTTRTITRQQAEDWELSCAAPGELHRETISRHRWYSVELVVFTALDDGLAYGFTCDVPATELQEGMDPWDDAEEIELTRFESYEAVVTLWRPCE